MRKEYNKAMEDMLCWDVEEHLKICKKCKEKYTMNPYLPPNHKDVSAVKESEITKLKTL